MIIRLSPDRPPVLDDLDRLDRLRKTETKETRVEVGLRKTTPIGNRILDPVLDGLALRAGYSRTRVATATLESEGSGVDARVEYLKEIGVRDIDLVPAFAEGVVRALLPKAWEESLLGARLRWTPTSAGSRNAARSLLPGVRHPCSKKR